MSEEILSYLSTEFKRDFWGDFMVKFYRCLIAVTRSSCCGRVSMVCTQREGKDDGKKSMYCFQSCKVERKWQCILYIAHITLQIHSSLFHLFLRTTTPSSYRPWLLVRKALRREMPRRWNTSMFVINHRNTWLKAGFLQMHFPLFYFRVHQHTHNLALIS